LIEASACNNYLNDFISAFYVNNSLILYLATVSSPYLTVLDLSPQPISSYIANYSAESPPLLGLNYSGTIEGISDK